jgi:hypothetical protein
MACPIRVDAGSFNSRHLLEIAAPECSSHWRFRSAVVDYEHHGALEALRACDEDAEPALERVGRDPRVVRCTDALAAKRSRPSRCMR